MHINKKISKKHVLIFDYQITGHHIEYINHLYLAASKNPSKIYYVAVPDSFKTVSEHLNWPYFPHVHIYYFSEKLLPSKGISIYKKSYFLSKMLKKLVRKLNIQEVFLISLMDFLPALPFILRNKKVSVSGIIYLLYPYRWKTAGKKTKIQDIVKYSLFSHLNIFNKIYLLNDSFIPDLLNKKYHTAKFHYLPDPYLPFIEKNLKNLRQELQIYFDKKVLLHFGSLAERKGTLEIMKAIQIADSTFCKDLCLIIAGKVAPGILENFYDLVKIIEKKIQLIVFDEFCSFNFIASLCFTSDFILTPYKETDRSSGVIAYAAQFKKPVVGPQKGLIGKLIKKNKLGVTIEEITPECILDGIRKAERWTPFFNHYLENHTIEKFQDTIEI